LKPLLDVMYFLPVISIYVKNLPKEAPNKCVRSIDFATDFS